MGEGLAFVFVQKDFNTLRWFAKIIREDYDHRRQNCKLKTLFVYLSTCDNRKQARLAEFFTPGMDFSFQHVNCAFDRLIVQVNESTAISHCGNDTFSVESTGKTMTIVLSTAFWSSGTKFLCELQAIGEAEKDHSCRCGWKKPVRAN